MKSADRERLSKFYSILFFVTGIPLTIGAIIGLIETDTFKLFYLWLLLALGVIGMSIAIYFNVSKRFIIYEENIDQSSKEG